MTIDRRTLALVAALVLGTWILAGRHATPTPADRPVLRAIARVAKLGLWMLTFAEPAPPEARPAHLVNARTGPDGHPFVDHQAGW